MDERRAAMVSLGILRQTQQPQEGNDEREEEINKGITAAAKFWFMVKGSWSNAGSRLMVNC